MIQNAEISDKVNKNGNEQVIELENDYSDTLLYFQPQDMEKYIEAVDNARQGYKLEKEIEGAIRDEAINKPVDAPEFNVLIAQSSENEVHAFYISNIETLTGLRFCPFCKSKVFNPRDVSFARDYEKRIKKCEMKERKILEEIKFEAVQRPFCPYIMKNKTQW
ncbi:MAG: hypothetical protein EZS28_009341 [Streblomastix strix]|uniref:Uncharacterized protein n=1 Tax=Streblomastix strix TaxID=222440 RepID=A0A5J4WK02_9EUKA|nr:MAG: hypothetical protein EZS28_009341 [Streblomastix strix]